MGGWRSGAVELAMLRPRTLLRLAFLGRFGICETTGRRTHRSGASGTNFEAVPGPAQFQVRAPEG
eukprot:13812267-Alexandrium_andersonii.AAC.1